MDADLKAKWVKALRSGEFKQSVGALRCEDAYCCLGVLLGVSGLGGWDDNCYVINDDDPECRTTLDGDLGHWNKSLGISNQDEGKLINMNDGEQGMRKHTFPEIADWIEANL